MSSYHLASAMVLPIKYDRDWIKPSPPNPNLPGPSLRCPPRKGRQCLAAWEGCGAGLGGSGPTGPPASWPTQRRGSGKMCAPSPSSPDGSRQVGKEQVMEGEASRLTCSQISTLCFLAPSGDPDRGTRLGGCLWLLCPSPFRRGGEGGPLPAPAGGLQRAGGAPGRGQGQGTSGDAAGTGRDAPGAGSRLAACSLAADF